jgi:hypothetical protein
MWLITIDGFYSVVVHRDNPANWKLVRARAKKDLVKLLARIDLAYSDDSEAHGNIREVRPSDYEFRVWVRSDVMAQMMYDMVDEIDYDNFKSAVGRIDSERSHVYMSVWSALHGVGRKWTGYSRAFGSSQLIHGKSSMGDLKSLSGMDTLPFVEESIARRGYSRSGDGANDVPSEDDIDEMLKHAGITEIGDVAESRHITRMGKKKRHKRFRR